MHLNPAQPNLCRLVHLAQKRIQIHEGSIEQCRKNKKWFMQDASVSRTPRRAVKNRERDVGGFMHLLS
jgi:hypothetical protein